MRNLHLAAAAASNADFHLKFGVVILLRSDLPNLVRQFAANGADFMVTVTNDAWFGPSSAPYQHFGMVVFRAVENHVAFARGIPASPDSSIRMAAYLQQSSIFTQEALRGRFPSAINRPFTPNTVISLRMPVLYSSRFCA